MSYKKIHAEKQRQEISATRKEVCKMYGLTLEEYSEREFELGLIFLEQKGYDMDFQYSKTFWGWWKVRIANANKEGLKSPGQMEEINVLSFIPLKSTLRQIKNESKRRTRRTDTLSLD